MNTNLSQYLSKNLRYDNRKFLDYRHVSVEYGVAGNADGSARVKIGKTDVIAGIKMEIMAPYPDTPDEGSMMVNVELLPLSSPDFESGPPSDYAVELARVVDRGIRESGAIDAKKLCVVPKEKVWMIVIDICTMNDDGNLFDAIGMATIAAIIDTRFPKLVDLVIDHKEHTNERIPLLRVPIEVTVIKIGGHLLVDPTIEEDKAVNARLTVSVTEDDNICALQKGGDEGLVPKEIMEMIEIAIRKSKELRKHLKK